MHHLWPAGLTELTLDNYARGKILVEVTESEDVFTQIHCPSDS